MRHPIGAHVAPWLPLLAACHVRFSRCTNIEQHRNGVQKNTKLTQIFDASNNTMISVKQIENIHKANGEDTPGTRCHNHWSSLHSPSLSLCLISFNFQ